ncbi:putative UDP-glucose-4-epimerase [Ilyonectria destructans]|nr:putative UDP-glucose-4-epimerase [Ilyonectria destructans]
MRVVVTGGSGKAGRYIIDELVGNGHQVLNLDLQPLARQDVCTLKTDLCQSGEAFNALTTPFKLTEPFSAELPSPPNAVIHLAAYARNMVVPDNETFRGNTVSTYNVIEAACKLGVKKIIVASSVTVYGVTYAHGDVDYASFPVDEEVDCNPTDAYAISKLCTEITCRGFAERYGVDIYVMRIGAVIAPDEYQAVFHGYVYNAGRWKVHGWSYTDARDLGLMCELGLQKSGLGFQIFNATNDTITNLAETEEFLRTQCPDTPFTRKLEKYEAPISNAKMKMLLGFQERHHWKNYFITRESGAEKLPDNPDHH